MHISLLSLRDLLCFPYDSNIYSHTLITLKRHEMTYLRILLISSILECVFSKKKFI